MNAIHTYMGKGHHLNSRATINLPNKSAFYSELKHVHFLKLPYSMFYWIYTIMLTKMRLKYINHKTLHKNIFNQLFIKRVAIKASPKHHVLT